MIVDLFSRYFQILLKLPCQETVTWYVVDSSCPSEYKLQSLLTKPQNGFSFIRTDTRQAISPTPGQTVQEEMQVGDVMIHEATTNHMGTSVRNRFEK